jgi:hypothetical protein
MTIPDYQPMATYRQKGYGKSVVLPAMQAGMRPPADNADDKYEIAQRERMAAELHEGS